MSCWDVESVWLYEYIVKSEGVTRQGGVDTFIMSEDLDILRVGMRSHWVPPVTRFGLSGGNWRSLKSRVRSAGSCSLRRELGSGVTFMRLPKSSSCRRISKS